MLPSKQHSVSKVRLKHLKRRPDAAVGYFMGERLNRPVCWLAPGATDDEWTNSRTVSWSEEFSRTVQHDLGVNVKKIHNSGLIDDLWT